MTRPQNAETGLEQAIIDDIREFIAADDAQGLYRSPLVAFASAKDPLFEQLKQAVSQTHETPESLLPGATSVVAWFLPFTLRIVKENRGGDIAAASWARAYVETNARIVRLSERLAALLEARGFRSALLPPTHNFDEERLMADWSHKHVAFIAGLGRFGSHHLLITEKGCCGRFGTLVTDAPLTPTPRPESEFCLEKAGKECGICRKNCTFGALLADKYDRRACYAMLLKNVEAHKDAGYADVCAKCCCGAPCAITNPV